MTRQFWLSILIIPVWSQIVFSEIPSYPCANHHRAFLCKWLICGSFPNPEEAYDKLDKQNSGFLC